MHRLDGVLGAVALIGGQDLLAGTVGGDADPRGGSDALIDGTAGTPSGWWARRSGWTA